VNKILYIILLYHSSLVSFIRAVTVHNVIILLSWHKYIQDCFADHTTMQATGNSSIDASLIHDIYCDPEVLFETCVAMKFVDDDNDVEDDNMATTRSP